MSGDKPRAARLNTPHLHKAPTPADTTAATSLHARASAFKRDFDNRFGPPDQWPHRVWGWFKATTLAVWLWLVHLPRHVQGIAAAIVLIVVGVILFLANPNWDWARGFVSKIASGRLHRPVDIDGHLRVHLFSFTPSATVGGLRIAEPAKGVTNAPKENLADIASTSASIELMPLFVGRIVLPKLQVDKPIVTLYQDASGNTNWDFSNGVKTTTPTKLPPIKNFIINDGHVSFTSLSRKMRFTGTVFAHETTGSGAQAFGFNGDGSLNGKVFTLKASGGPLLNVRTSAPYPFEMAARADNTVITAKGRVIHPFNLGQVEGAVTVSGDNLTDLYYLTGLTLPDTAAYKVSANVTRNDRIYNITGINGRIGGSDIEGRLKVELSNKAGEKNRLILTGDLASRALNFKDLGSLFGATNANKPGTLTVSATPEATTGRRLLPDVPLDVERVRGMDAKVRYRALSVIATDGLPLRQVALGVELNHGLLTLDPIDLSFPQGRLQGNAIINAREAVQKDSVDLRLTGLAVQDFTPAFQGSKPIEGILDARARLSGTGNTVHKAAGSANGRFTAVIPAGTLRQSLAELLGIDATKGLFMLLAKDPKQTDIRCAVADFNVQNGVMTAQSIILDTGVVVVNGTGSLNLNDESFKLIFKGKPKQFRLIRLNAPIIVGGHLTAPTFGAQAGPAIVQAGLAGALRSVIPFIGLNTAKDTNCSALLAAAQNAGAPTTLHAAPKKVVAAPPQ